MTPSFHVLLVLHSLLTFRASSREYLMRPLEEGGWGFFKTNDAFGAPRYKITDGQFTALLNEELFVLIEEGKTARLLMPFSTARSLGEYLTRLRQKRQIEVLDHVAHLQGIEPGEN